MASLTERIKQFALNQGYFRVGVAPAEDFTEWIEEVRLRGEDKYSFLSGGNPAFFDLPLITTRRPEAKSIIALVWDYAQTVFPDLLLRHFGRFYLARGYNAPPEHINGARLALVRQFLEDNGCTLIRGVFVPDRLAGTRAGVVSYGRNSFAYAEGIGSFVMISTLVVDKELEYDMPVTECSCPPECTRCMDACPTGAIYEPFRVDPRRCLSCNMFFTNKKIPGMADTIPEDIREGFGERIYGCDVCQDVCPRNQIRLKTRTPARDGFLDDLASRFSLEETLRMQGEYYETSVRPVAYNYIKNPAYLQRNAAVALGNSGDPKTAVPLLKEALSHERAFVRGHAAWALGKLGGEDALEALRSHAEREDDPEALREVRAAVSRIRNTQDQGRASE